MSSASERPLLQAGLGDRVSLHFHGACFGSPVSEAHTRNLTSQPGHCMVLHGCYKNSRIGELLAGLAAVIVPSLWLDNEPLTIQEAQIAGVPVIQATREAWRSWCVMGSMACISGWMMPGICGGCFCR